MVACSSTRGRADKAQQRARLFLPPSLFMTRLRGYSPIKALKRPLSFPFIPLVARFLLLLAFAMPPPINTSVFAVTDRASMYVACQSPAFKGDLSCVWDVSRRAEVMPVKELHTRIKPSALISRYDT
jgi:hypothetical protein